MTGKCEWRLQFGARSGDSCGFTAPYRVSRGTRRYDAQNSCRVHLARTADMLAEGQECDIVVHCLGGAR